MLRGVAKPDWFPTASWRDDAREVVWRADEMELVSSAVINSSGVIATDPKLPDSWWASLKKSLAALADLHWGNLTAPDCYLLDWQDWGAAPRGYDAAVLWGFSLPISGLADRVQREFQILGSTAQASQQPGGHTKLTMPADALNLITTDR